MFSFSSGQALGGLAKNLDAGELPLPEEDMVVISEGREISAQNVPLCFEWQVWEHVILNLTLLPAESERQGMRCSVGPLDVHKVVLNL